jgi:hypothetical protein
MNNGLDFLNPDENENIDPEYNSQYNYDYDWEWLDRYHTKYGLITEGKIKLTMGKRYNLSEGVIKQIIGLAFQYGKSYNILDGSEYPHTEEECSKTIFGTIAWSEIKELETSKTEL